MRETFQVALRGRCPRREAVAFISSFFFHSAKFRIFERTPPHGHLWLIFFSQQMSSFVQAQGLERALAHHYPIENVR